MGVLRARKVRRSFGERPKVWCGRIWFFALCAGKGAARYMKGLGNYIEARAKDEGSNET